MVKYPLTAKAKEGARLLLKSWDEKKKDQYVAIASGDVQNENFDIVSLSRERVLEEWGYPLAGVLFELSKYGLIDVNCQYTAEGKMARIEILLLQELRNAVESDFEVSDYFLTMNAVGTIVQGNLTIHPGGFLQSAASNTGNVTLNVQQIADDLVGILGQPFLERQVALKESIEELRYADESNKKSRIGKVIGELGHCLEHGANAATLITAIAQLSTYLSNLL